MFERERLEEALATLGALLEERDEHIGILVVGGASLLLLGVVERPTADIDVVGFSSPAGYTKAERFPGSSPWRCVRWATRSGSTGDGSTADRPV